MFSMDLILQLIYRPVALPRSLKTCTPSCTLRVKLLLSCLKYMTSSSSVFNVLPQSLCSP
jgi:hypothetical protein